MILSKKEMSFCMKTTLEENSGSAAEPQVRPPNMHEFRGHVRLPKVFDQATYKEPSDRKWASFLPILELR